MSRPNYHRWTDAELDTLRQLYPVEPARVIAERLGLSIKQVYAKAHGLGLNKPGDYHIGGVFEYRPEKLELLGKVKPAYQLELI